MTTYGKGREGPPASLAEMIGTSSSPSRLREGKPKQAPSKLQTFFRGGAKREPFKSPVKPEAGSSYSSAGSTQLVITRKDGKQEIKRRPTQ